MSRPQAFLFGGHTRKGNLGAHSKMHSKMVVVARDCSRSRFGASSGRAVTQMTLCPDLFDTSRVPHRMIAVLRAVKHRTGRLLRSLARASAGARARGLNLA